MKRKRTSLLRLLCSRYWISALLILTDLAGLALCVLYASRASVLIFIANLLIEAAVILHLINRDTNQEYKIPWLVTVMLLPVFGALLYLLFSESRMTKKEACRLSLAVRTLNALSPAPEQSDRVLGLRAEHPLTAGKALAVLRGDPLAQLYTGTSSRYFREGEDYLEALAADIAAAKQYVFLEYFIIASGSVWEEIHALLCRKAEEGVEVRVIFDDIGCMATLPDHYENLLRAQGIRAVRFGRISPRPTPRHNHRDHRKIAVIDGEIAYTGGVNLADEYANRKERFGHWKDGGIRLRGDAALGMAKLFLSLWDALAEEGDGALRYLAQKDSASGDGGYYIPFGSGPAPVYRRSVAKDIIRGIIDQSQRFVYITTPYLIIDYDLTESLCNAALRGVDVKIATPGIPDKKFVYLMTRSSYPALLQNGVEIYEYIPGFLHEKSIVSDGEIAVSGTVNLDYRSLVHHYEDGVWMAYTPTVGEMEKSFLHTVGSCRKIERTEMKFTFGERLARMLIRLFAPLL